MLIHTKYKWLVLNLVLPVFFFPFYMLAQILLDYLVGDSLALDSFMFHSKFEFVRQFLLDWVNALVFVYPLFIFLLVICHCVSAISDFGKVRCFVISSIIISSLSGLYLQNMLFFLNVLLATAAYFLFVYMLAQACNE